MGVIVNIIGSAITNVKFDGVAIENGFEITKNGTLTFDCVQTPVYVNDNRLLGVENSNTLDLDVSSLSEITLDNESMGFVGDTYNFTVNITGLAITQLAPFLTNIANAIRTKKGTTETINAQNFASEIESIESGGRLTGYTGTVGYNDYVYGRNPHMILTLLKPDFTVEYVEILERKQVQITTPVIAIGFFYTPQINGYENKSGVEVYMHSLSDYYVYTSGMIIPTENNFQITLIDDE